MFTLLENWEVVYAEADAYTAPENCPRLLRGNCYNHPEFANGARITTSPIVKIDRAKGLATTRSGRRYTLGKMRPEYADFVKGL